MRTRVCLPYAECTMRRAKWIAVGDPREPGVGSTCAEHQCTNWTKGRGKGESQTNDALSQCAHVCGPLLRSRKQICVVTTPTAATVPSFFLPLQRRSQTIELSNGGGREGDNIQNGFLMGGNHSPMIRMTLPRKRETMGDGGGSKPLPFLCPLPIQ